MFNQYYINKFKGFAFFSLLAVVDSYTYVEQSFYLRSSYNNNKISRSLAESDNFTCTVPAEDCNNHGGCNREANDCICDDGYLTFPKNNTNKCSYKQSKQWIAFILELFLGIFGAGNWYLGRNEYAAIKVCILWVFPCFSFLLTLFYTIICIKESKNSEKKNSNTEECGYCIGLLWSLTIFTWCVIDLIIIAIGDIEDGQGAPIESW